MLPSRSIRLLHIVRIGIAFTFASAVPSVPLSAQAPVTDQDLEQLIQAAATRAGVVAVRAVPVRASDQGVVRLSVDDAIAMALEQNLDIAVQRLTPQTFDYTLAGLRSAYRPTLVTALSQQSQSNPSTQTISGGTVGTGIISRTTQYNLGLSQSLALTGGTLALQLNNSRATTTSTTALFDPAYNSNWSLTLTQPLLRDLWIDNTRQQIDITALNRDNASIELQATIINTVSDVRNAYWDHVFAVESVELARSSLALAEQLVLDNRRRVEIGTMAPMDVVQAEAEAATQRQNLAVAEGNRRTAELALKRLIVGGTEDPTWLAVIDPTDRPEFSPITVDPAQAVQAALENRTDLEQVRRNLTANDVTLSYLGNQALPRVDLTARYQLVGQGGTQFITSGTGVNRVVTGTIPGGYRDAIETLWNRNYPTWSVGVTASFPIGTSSQEANLRRARLQARQVEAQLRQIELQIAAEVTNASIQVVNSIERVQAAQAARELAAQQLDAEQRRFDVGASTNYFLVQAQRDFARAQNSELEAVLAYRRSLVEFERLQQTSPAGSNITILGR